MIIGDTGAELEGHTELKDTPPGWQQQKHLMEEIDAWILFT